MTVLFYDAPTLFTHSTEQLQSMIHVELFHWRIRVNIKFTTQVNKTLLTRQHFYFGN